MNKFNVSEILKFQKQAVIDWHVAENTGNQAGFLKMVADNHWMNFQLWHEEDKARREDMGFEYVYQAKRNIDRFNQARNNFVEAMDKAIFEAINPSENAPVNSETPGMMIDRLSILSLKEFHMAEQTERQDVELLHIAQCQQKLAVIRAQISQLGKCLEEFFSEMIAGKRTFRVYYQFKMYNDAALNPELYQA